MNEPNDYDLGIYDNIDEDIYHNINAFSKSQATRILDCHAKAKMPWQQSEAMEFGTAFHCAILEPKKFATQYIEMPKIDKRTKIGKQQYTDFMTANENKKFLKTGQTEQIEGMKKSIYSHPIVKDLLLVGKSEISLFWEDELTSISCKARVDWKPKGKRLLVDIKTARDASELGFQRAVVNMRYYMQAAVYMHAWNMFSVLEDAVTEFLFIVVEKDPPYRFNPYSIHINSEYTRLGIEHWSEAIIDFQQCKKTGIWKTYNVKPEMIREIDAPGWFK